MTASNSGGDSQLVSVAPKWWDSSSSGSSPDGPGGLGVPQPVPATVTRTQVTLDVAAVAHTEDVAYPVYVDPSWIGSTIGWSFVDKAYPDQSYWKDAGASDNAQHVGYVDAGHSDDGSAHTTRSYWQMGSSAVNHTHIKAASFQVTNVYSYSCSVRQVDLYTAAVATSATTWNNQPALAALVDSQSFAYGYSASCAASTNNVAFDARSAVQRAADAASDAINFALVAHDESDAFGWKKFGGQARLVITYESYPTQPAYRKVTPCWAVCGLGAWTRSAYPTVQAMADIADSGVNLDYAFQVCTGAQYETCKKTFYHTDQKPGVVISRPMPVTEGLADGPWSYRVQACRSDDAAVCGDWSGWFAFHVDTHRPDPPVVTSAELGIGDGNNNPGAVLGSPTSFDIAPAPAETDEYEYSWATVSGAYTLSSAICPRTGANSVKILCAAGSTEDSLVPYTTSGVIAIFAYDKAGNQSVEKDYTYTAIPTLGSMANNGWYAQSADFFSSPHPSQIANVADGDSN